MDLQMLLIIEFGHLIFMRSTAVERSCDKTKCIAAKKNVYAPL